MRRIAAPAFFVAAAAILFSFANPKDNPKKKFKGYQKAEGGSYFLLVRKGTGTTTVDTGGAVFGKLKFLTENDSVFIDINQQAQSPSYPMRVDKYAYKGDFLFFFLRLHVGDSAKFFVSLDSLRKYYPNDFNFAQQGFGPSISGMKYLGFAVSVDSIYSRAKVEEARSKALAQQIIKQEKEEKIQVIMQPIWDTAAARAERIKAHDFDLMQEYIKNSWKGPHTPDNYGIFYQEIRPGTGDSIRTGMIVGVRYTGKYLDGTIFDSNMLTPDQEPLVFRYGVDPLIQGFTICVGKMKLGTKAIFILPPAMGYSDGLTRIFEVEVVSVSTH